MRGLFGVLPDSVPLDFIVELCNARNKHQFVYPFGYKYTGIVPSHVLNSFQPGSVWIPNGGCM
jgi:hypothetical protein